MPSPIITKIVVNLNEQKLYAYENASQVYDFHCTTGDNDHPTPAGTWRIYRKHESYRSRKYDAQMDWAMFFHEGYAIHMAYAVTLTSFLRRAGLGYFGSHGCVRLPEDNARTLFSHTPTRTLVQIVRV